MSKIVIIAETGSDITKEVAKENGITLVPMHVSFGNETKDDGSFSSEEIYEYYERTGELPRTSGCVPEDFRKVIAELRRDDPDCEILYLAYSAATTCSYQSAQIAIDTDEIEKIACVDTKQVSAGQYAVVLRMAEELRRHPEWSLKDAKQAAEEIAGRVHMCFIPDTLKFLRAGGRVSNGAAIAGELLKLHPQIEIQDGKLQATKKHRGKMSKIVAKLIPEYIGGQRLDKEKLYLIWSPGMDAKTKETAEQTAKKCGVNQVVWVRTGGVITCHGGPGAFGIVRIYKNES